MLGAVMFGHQQMQVVINAINEMADAVGKDAWDWTPPAKNEALIAKIAELAEKICRPLMPCARNRRVPSRWKRSAPKPWMHCWRPDENCKRMQSTICSVRWKPRSCAARS